MLLDLLLHGPFFFFSQKVAEGSPGGRVFTLRTFLLENLAALGTRSLCVSTCKQSAGILGLSDSHGSFFFFFFFSVSHSPSTHTHLQLLQSKKRRRAELVAIRFKRGSTPTHLYLAPHRPSGRSLSSVQPSLPLHADRATGRHSRALNRCPTMATTMTTLRGSS